MEHQTLSVQDICRIFFHQNLRGLINSEHGDAESTSFFGEVYYDLNDTTKLTVGLRYDENDNYFQLINTLGDALLQVLLQHNVLKQMVVF